MAEHQELNRHSDTNLIHVIASRMESMHGDMSDVKTALKDLASAIIKLALVEERQGQAALAQERAFKVIERLEVRIDAGETRIDALERAAPMTAQTNTWVMAGVWGFAAIVATLLLSVLARKLGLA